MSTSDLRASISPAFELMDATRRVCEADFQRFRGCVQAQRWPQVVLLEAPSTRSCQQIALFLSMLFYCASQEGCGQCAGCTGVLHQSNADFLWVEAEESGMLKLSDVQPLLQHLKIKAMTGQGHRVAVLHSVDRLGIAAANAMLKDLEELPEQSLMVMTTSKPQHVIDTIRSRAVVVRITRVPAEEPIAVPFELLRLLSAQSDDVLISSAEHLSRKLKLSVEELVRATELALNQAYREGDVAIIGDLSKIKSRRLHLSRLKQVVGRAKVNLNPQLCVEGLALV